MLPLNRSFIKLLFILLIGISGSNLFGQQWTTDDIEVYNSFEDLEHVLKFKNDTTYLINFWATWCGPCVKEMPFIEALHQEFESQKFKIILVSLDFKKHLESKLIPFLNKNNIQSNVVLLLDDKANRWIDKVDSSWSGAIPISIVYKNEKRQFYEREFHNSQELVDIINPFINNK